MTKKISFKLDFDHNVDDYLKEKYPGETYRIRSKSLDARGAPRGKRPCFHYVIELGTEESTIGPLAQEIDTRLPNGKEKPLIIGAGPAGLFSALRLLERGIPSIIVERGSEANKRMLSIAKFWRYGELDEDDNVCFGEGGAGLFSDGKLITRVKSPHIDYIMNRLVAFGADPEIAYLANPHLGSNKIRGIISRLSNYLLKNGCQIYYNTSIEKFLFSEKNEFLGFVSRTGQTFYSQTCILAAGHSAHNIYYELHRHKVKMSLKDFSVGLRVEHPRTVIDKIQYGKYCDNPALETARYRLSYHNQDTDRGTYSFCMCPGGHVLSSGTERDGLVVNGMSNSGRNSPWSNSALVVSTKAGPDFSQDDLFAGLKFQRQIEKAFYNYSALKASGRELPSLEIRDFLKGKVSSNPLPKSSTPSKTHPAPLYDLLPQYVVEHLRQGLEIFNQQMPGFIDRGGLLLGPETRTSAPLRIDREEDLQSSSHPGLYPCGEGAGYAGGITSAACDGVRVAEALKTQFL